MGAFSTTLADFYAGEVSLPHLVAVLRDDLLHDRQALFDDTTLIESAWRSGRVDREVYQLLRETIVSNVQIAAAPLDGAAQVWPEIRASHGWLDDAAEPQDTSDDATLFRASKNSCRPASTSGDTFGRGSALSSSPRSGPWTTDSPQWSDEPAREVSTGSVLKDRFVLEEIIGRGGMGTVYRARDVRKEEAQDRYPYVAVKVLNEDFRRHPESFKALQREAKKSQSLAHPNVVSVYDFDRDGAVVFLVMELLEGQSLEEVIQNRARRGLPRAETLRIIRSVGAALSYAHQKGVVHSDFKPANTIRTKDGAIKVLDFGIARAIAGPSQTLAETTHFNVKGLGAVTPAYASYEMLVGEPAHPSDDVYALACVTYELLAGRHPFGYLSALLAQSRGLKPIPIEGLNRASWRALARGLALSRDERTPSVDAFLAELVPKHGGGLIFGSIAATAVAVTVGAWTYVPAFRSFDPIGVWRGAELPALSDSANATTSTAGPAVRIADPRATTTKQAITGKQEDLTSVPPDTASLAESSSPVASTVSPEQKGPMHKRLPLNSEASKELEPITAMRAVFSEEQLKERLISFARINEVPDALATLRELEARLGPENEFVQYDGPHAIGQAYSRLAERAFTDGNYSAAIALLDRASEQAPDLTIFAARRKEMQKVADTERILEEGADLSSEMITNALEEIRGFESARYSEIRSRLASTLARRIKVLQDSSPAEANRLLGIGQISFAGTSAIENLTLMGENVSSARKANEDPAQRMLTTAP